MIRHSIKVLSRAGASGRLTVLTFHRALAQPDDLLHDEPDAVALNLRLSYWGKWFKYVSLGEAVSRLRSGNLAKSCLCVTFDDGYEDNLTVAVPELLKLGIPATFFIATKFSDGGMMFNDRVIAAVRGVAEHGLDTDHLKLGRWDVSNIESKRATIAGILQKVKHKSYDERERITLALAEQTDTKLDPHPMMTREQVKTLASKGFEIGAHTISHPILREIPDERARFEITEGRKQLQALTGQKVEMFAYPNGRPGEDYDLRHVQMVKDAGFIGAVSTIQGAASKHDDLYQIPRFTPWHGASWKSGVQFLRNYRTPIRSLKA
jgi:peptidoglycan/xylan/chitin deacetylase (PgdA/CDA1 family)